MFGACEHSHAYTSKKRNEQFMCINNTSRLAQIQCNVTSPTGWHLMLPTIFCKTREYSYIITAMQCYGTTFAVPNLCSSIVMLPCLVGSLLPQHGASSGCGWWDRLQLWRVAANKFYKQARTVLQLGGWAWGIQPSH
jgi:hypothetical protein